MTAHLRQRLRPSFCETDTLRLRFPLDPRLSLPLLAAACSSGKANPQAETPPQATVQPDLDSNNFTVAHPDQFPLATAVTYLAGTCLERHRSRAARYHPRRSRGLAGIGPRG